VCNTFQQNSEKNIVELNIPPKPPGKINLTIRMTPEAMQELDDLRERYKTTRTAVIESSINKAHTAIIKKGQK
jgi:hypothetical protein